MGDVSIKDASIGKIFDEPEMTVKFEGFENLESCRKFLLKMKDACQAFNGQLTMEAAQEAKQQ